MWTALLVVSSAQYPGQETPQAVQSGLAIECTPSATMALVVVAMALATRLGRSMVKLSYKLVHWMSSSVLVVHKLLTAWALEGLGTGAAGQTLVRSAGDAEAIDGALHARLVRGLRRHREHR